MPTPLPPDPVGHHPFVDWCRSIRKCLAERTVLAGPGVRLKYETGGTRLQVEQPKQLERGSILRWRGEWESGVAPVDDLGPYLEGDIVIRGSNNVSRVPTDPPLSETEIAEQAKALAEADMSDGTICGTFVAIADLVANTAEPETDGNFWEMLGRSSFSKFTVRDTGANKISMNSVSDGVSTLGNVNIDLNDTYGKDLSIKEVEVCVNGDTKYMLVIASEPYANRVT